MVTERTPPGTPSARHIAASAPGEGVFAPGQMLADRYRIAGLLGRGGMGEVYRADDLKLGTAVALKFLPRQIENDAAALERFHAEVRTARQVSHPHVCRVYDIGETGGRHFLSMEYVDGEDLATLLHRIGRLPPTKAVEIARQLCAGLAAAHDKGVLHRDLKPANVMIDGHGRARIADFGLAVLSADATADIAGTPAYMAPEQLAGRPATVQSDLYALGLVLYEIFTGARTFQAASFAEWRRVHAETVPASPSHHTADIDPVAERVILRCLEKDPAQRPRSAMQVALALPGGDPLAAAIAAGETPSPAMVAAAGGEGGLRSRHAWALLLAFAVLFGSVAVLSRYSTDLGLAPMQKTPDVLRERARSIVAQFGYNDPPGDEVTWLERDYAPLRWLADHVPSPEWRRRLSGIGAPVVLHYRRSAQRMVSSRQGVVGVADPSPDIPGDILLVVDAKGRLQSLRAMPPREGLSPATPAAIDEPGLFEAAGLDRARFEPVPPSWVPPLPFDARMEWRGTRADIPEIPLRLSVTSFAGRVTSVTVLEPWSAENRARFGGSTSARIAILAIVVVMGALFVAVFIVARRNLRLGRGDRRGAFRIAVATFGIGTVGSLVRLHPADDVPALAFTQVLPGLGEGIVSALSSWMVYIALEPFVRRRMPGLLVGWTRMLDGRWRDPRVGREVLTGLVLGMLTAVATHVANGLPTWFPFDRQTPVFFFGYFRWEYRLEPLPVAFDVTVEAMQRALAGLALLLACRLILKRERAAAVMVAVLFTLFGLGGENPRLETPAALLNGVLFAIAVSRLGLLGFAAMWWVALAALTLPIGIGFTQWYAPYALLTLVLLAGAAIGAFLTSLGGRSPFGDVKLDA